MNHAAAATGRRARTCRCALRRLFPGSLFHRRTQQPIPTAVDGRRLLYVAVLAGSLSLFGTGLAGADGAPQQRAVQIVLQVAQSLAARLTSVGEDGCADQSPILPFPAAGDDGFIPTDVGLANLECDQR